MNDETQLLVLGALTLLGTGLLVTLGARPFRAQVRGLEGLGFVREEAGTASARTWNTFPFEDSQRLQTRVLRHMGVVAEGRRTDYQSTLIRHTAASQRESVWNSSAHRFGEVGRR